MVMTPKEKAKELFLKFRQIPPSSPYTGVDDGEAKQCALIAVDEILKRTRSVDTMPPNCQKIDDNTKEYWQQVKQEIEWL